jgi:hypothetical protein
LLPQLLQQGVKDPDEAGGSPDTIQPGVDFAPTAQFFGLIGLIGILYGWSFRQVWIGNYTYAYSYDAYLQSLPKLGILTPFLSSGIEGISLLFLLLGSGGLWIGNLRHHRHLREPRDSTQKEGSGLMNRVVESCLLLMLILLSVGALWGVSLVLVNLALFGLAAVITWDGLHLAQRWRFWLGLLTLTLLVLTRFFEYDTDLLLKSFALLVCGIGVILAGLKFERVLAQRGSL